MRGRSYEERVEDLDPSAKSIGANETVKGSVTASVAIVLDCGHHASNEKFEEALAVE